MCEKYPDYKWIWLYNSATKESTKGITYVKKNTIKWIKEILTCKILITNGGFPPYFPYRKKQVLIETWHGGGAYKKMVSLFISNNNAVTKSLCYISNCLCYYISSSKKFTEVMSQSMMVNISKFLSIGMPRNDVFFNEMLVNNNKKNVIKKLGYNENEYIVLYAPTYRTSNIYLNLDVKQLKLKIKTRYKKDVKLLFRGHTTYNNVSLDSDYDYDVSQWNDMQELLCAADMLITDYSSSMWDYSFLYRPCFLFAPDIEEYMSNRGFYTDPYSWGFPICKNNEELANAIETFDATKFIKAIKKHHDDLGSYEKGTATEQIVEKIVNCLKSNE